jgi:hypothetical protein
MKRNQSFHKISNSLIAHKSIILLALCLIGIAGIVFGRLRRESAVAQENKIVSFVKQEYALLSEGKYDTLSENVIEGQWRGHAKEFALSGLIQKEAFTMQLEDDLGVGGWRLHFVTLKAIEYFAIERKAFETLLKRESQILDQIDPLRHVGTVHIVRMAGHNTGRCSIVQWDRLVPVIDREGRYMIIMRGAPDVYSLVHNEQWFQAVKF